MNIKYLLVVLIFISNSIYSQSSKLFETNRGKAYSYPIGSVKIISDKAYESKIKLPVSERNTEIDIFLNEYNAEKNEFINKNVCVLKFSKNESRYFSIIVDTVKCRTKMLLSTSRFMSEFKIDKRENLKFIFIDQNDRKEYTPIVILYYDTIDNKLENKLKSKRLINNNMFSNDLNSIYKIISPQYTVTIKERII